MVKQIKIRYNIVSYKKLNKNMRGGDSTDGKLFESGKQRFFEYEK